MDGSIQGPGPVHHNLRVVHVTFDQPGPAVYRGHGLIHQRVVFDKLQGLVRQVEGAREVGRPCLPVDALQETDQPSPWALGHTARAHTRVEASPTCRTWEYTVDFLPRQKH